METYHQFFVRAFNSEKTEPFDYQVRLALDDSEREIGHPCQTRLISVPTGLGKTAAVVLAWVWNRVIRQNPDWPHRLVFTLPQRTLVEQTYDCVNQWLKNLGLDWDGTMGNRAGKIGLHKLMGGESAGSWEQYPEENAILIGTQDMVVSAVLNRGYGTTRFRWPMHFGLLNNDCLYVFDEIQLMGPALPTTSQLAAFRKSFGTGKPCHTWWMSATGDPTWLSTVDFDPRNCLAPLIELTPEEKEKPAIRKLTHAKKSLRYAEITLQNPKKLAAEIKRVADERKGLTLAVINTVDDARALHTELLALSQNLPPEQQPVLLHSHFRQEDREKHLASVLAAEASLSSRIVVSTQIIEAGVDLSATALFTQIAPWSSLVQRFGRCNRRGNLGESLIHIIESAKSLPYEDAQLDEARGIVTKLIASGGDASPSSLGTYPPPNCDRPASKHVIRRRDFIELFDTTPDLSGQDIDIDRWIRDAEDSKIRVFWRDWEGNNPPSGSKEFPQPHRSELCPAPIAAAGKWADKNGLWQWNHLEARWQKVGRDFGKSQLMPGRIYLAHVSAGGYSPLTGFDPKSSASVESVTHGNGQETDQAMGDDALSATDNWQSVREHTNDVCKELERILRATDCSCDALPHAARWHDLGKTHPSFAAKIKTERAESPEGKLHLPHAKAPDEAWHSSRKTGYENHRPYFRHELASALAILQPECGDIPTGLRDLVAWLVATHHGKIRLGIRSLPDEKIPTGKDPRSRFARGVCDGDILVPTELGDGIKSPEIKLSLEPMALGLCEDGPFTGQPSWTDRMLALRDDPETGPLRLAWWEALLRAADERASMKNQTYTIR